MGFWDRFSSKKVELKAEPKQGRGRTRDVIKKQPKREVSFQIADIKTGLQLANNVDDPDRSRILDIYDYIIRDAHLKSAIKTARTEVMSEPWIFYIDGNPNLELSEEFNKKWLNTIIKGILESELYGFTLLELDKIDVANIQVGDIFSYPRQYVSIEKQWILVDGTINGKYLPYADLVDKQNLLEFGDRTDLGILLECSYNVIWKFYSRSDWSRGSEKFAMPILSIEADTNNDGELDALENKAANFGTDGYIVTQAGDKVTLVERTGQRMHDIWLDNIKLCNDEISKSVNGQTGTSDEKAFVGGAEVHERIMQGFTFTRLTNIVNEMNEKVLPLLKRKGFPLPDNAKFDYPSLVRERKRKIEGIPTPSEAPKEETPDQENKKKESKPTPPKKD